MMDAHETDLQGKTALVTGAASGIGAAVSVVAAREPVVQTHSFNSIPDFP